MQLTAPAAPFVSTAPVAVAAAQAGAAKPAPAGRAAFASLLQQSRSAQAAQPKAAAQGADPANAAADDAVDAVDAPTAPNPALKARLKPADKAAPARSAPRDIEAGAPAETSPETSAKDTADAAPAKRSDPSLADPAPAPCLPALHQQALAEAAARRLPKPEAIDAAAGNGSADYRLPGAESAKPSLLEQNNATNDSRASLEAAAASQEALALWTRSARADNAAPQHGLQAATDERGRTNPGVMDFASASASAAALGAAAFNQLLPGAARDYAAPANVNIPTALASPEFAQALGVQMSVLASSGVQRAELQLNPADMGPVSVRIVIDGTSARVDFGADLAATRHAIEAGLPELAGALREAGFTLTGGGVSQHSGGRSASSDTPGDAGHGRRPDADAAAADLPPQAAPLRRAIAAGGVDLYA